MSRSHFEENEFKIKLEEFTVSTNLKLNSSCIQLDVMAGNWEEAIVKAASPLIENGYVTPGYVDDVIERELQWATGLPTEPLGVAIPHALKPDNVLHAQIAVCRLREPVPFHQSGGTPGEDDVPCQIIFVLALKDPQAQLSLLQSLMVVISDEELLCELRDAATVEEFNDIFTHAYAND